jgi:magnesium transporter
MLQVFILMSDGTVVRNGGAAEIAAALRDPQARMWVDMEAPSDAEVELLCDTFIFHPLAIEDSVTYTQRPKVELYKDDGGPAGRYFYMVFHGPDLATFRENVRTKEIDMFVSDRYLVTVHDEPMQTVKTMAERCNIDVADFLGQGIDMVLYRILDYLIDGYDTILDHVEQVLDEVEEQAINDPKPVVLTTIAVRKKELLNLRRIIGPQREVLAQLTRGEVPFIRESTRIYLRDVYDHLMRVVELVELYRDLIMGSRDIYLSSLSNHLNQVMKTLTIISVIGVPLTITTGFFGMNFDEPRIFTHEVFIGTLIFMVTAVAGMLYLFWKKRWI